MQNNYYFLRPLTRELSTRLIGLELVLCFSQEKDELVLGFVTPADAPAPREFYIKAVLHPDLACLVFPTSFQRARKNSVDLFAELIGRQVQEVRQYLNERCFSVTFDGAYTLLFKMHGNRSNLLLFQGEQFVDMFHQKLVSDRHIRLDQLDRPMDQTYEAFLRAEGRVQKLFPTFGKPLLQYLQAQGLQRLPLPGQWELVQDLLRQLDNPTFYVTRISHIPALSLVQTGEILWQTREPIAAANEFYSQFSRLDSLDKEKGEAVRTLQKRKQKTEAYLFKSYEKLEELEKGARHEQLANILMANLHEIPPRSEAVELFDFYHSQPVRIKLKPDLTPQKNAEVYYRKAKNEKIEIAKLRENIAVREQDLREIDTHLGAVEALESVRELRKYIKTNQLLHEVVAETPDELFRRFSCLGFDIWVGRNAKNNDLLTQKYTFKEDLWLHARDVPGSHVVIKYQSGKNFPQRVIEKAAQLAAWFSKRKNDSLCPVIVTPKKFVRKPKGLPEGEVVVDKEEVIMVVPELWTDAPAAS